MYVPRPDPVVFSPCDRNLHVAFTLADNALLRDGLIEQRTGKVYSTYDGRTPDLIKGQETMEPMRKNAVPYLHPLLNLNRPRVLHLELV